MKLKTTLEKKNLLNIFCTAGFPQLEDLPSIVDALHKAGADMVEIGMPYSDPIADGPTIQKSNKIALENGINMERIFEQIKKCNTQIPKILMGYLNPVLQYGMERFCQDCVATGVEGIILPDLPVELYERKYKVLFEEYGLSMIFLITPQTSLDRIKKIDGLSSTFIYAVSSSSTTGKGEGISSAADYLEGLKNLPVTHPILVGFNISQPEDLALVHQHAQGGIIGSAFIKHLMDKKEVAQATSDFVKFIKSNNI